MCGLCGKDLPISHVHTQMKSVDVQCSIALLIIFSCPSARFFRKFAFQVIMGRLSMYTSSICNRNGNDYYRRNKIARPPVSLFCLGISKSDKSLGANYFWDKHTHRFFLLLHNNTQVYRRVRLQTRIYLYFLCVRVWVHGWVRVPAPTHTLIAQHTHVVHFTHTHTYSTTQTVTLDILTRVGDHKERERERDR